MSEHIGSQTGEPPGAGASGPPAVGSGFRARLLDAVEQSIVATDPEGRIIFWNRAAERLYGWPVAEVIGRSLMGAELWGDTADRGDEIASAVSRRESWSGDVRARRRDGSTFPALLSVTPMVGDDGELVAVVGVTTDITTRKAAEERARRLSVIVESSPDAIIGSDLEGRVTTWNPAAEELYGYSGSEILGEHIAVLAPEDRQEEITFLLAHVSRGQAVRNFETVRRRKSGELIHVSLTVSPILGEHGEVVGVAGTTRDITEQVRLAAAAEQHRRRLEEVERLAALRNVERQAAERASQAKSEFISRMSHELRTPLNAVLGFAQILQLEAGEEHREAVEQILRAGHHLLDLINEVLDIARIESGHLNLSLEPVEVSDVLRAATELIAPSAMRREIAMLMPGDIEPGLAVVADRQRLMQVLLNLLSNAVKYNRRGGRVELGVEHVAEDRVRISVTDTGPGVDPADFERIFMPFERLGAEQTDIEGTGVGLPLARGLVEKMRGAMGVHSELGQGATFWVELPLAVHEPEQPTTREAPRLQPRPVQDMVVLYIDDNLANVRLVERVLQMRAGVELMSAMQGRLGLELAREHHPDLILLDVHLPDLCGADVLAELRAEPATAEVPVAVVSADASTRMVQKFEQAGADFYLTKPFDLDELLEIVDRVRSGTEGGDSISGEQ
ncbi:PAS domain S-box protein [Rhabdothermincola sediminis]|uniref:PAS domain S-box protein n=1 Tax=Rhabdothermincola sediminis TaxID=2751370 RepID=UPI001AA0A1E2|nr:PAS domain S-box protein [Rhabdothermincola sediminis]